MTSFNRNKHILMWGTTRIIGEKAVVSGGCECAFTSTADRGIYSRAVGSKCFKVEIYGSFLPEKLSQYTTIIRSGNKTPADVSLDGVTLGSCVMSDGEVTLSDDGLLGKFHFEFTKVS